MRAVWLFLLWQPKSLISPPRPLQCRDHIFVIAAIKKIREVIYIWSVVQTHKPSSLARWTHYAMSNELAINGIASFIKPRSINSSVHHKLRGEGWLAHLRSSSGTDKQIVSYLQPVNCYYCRKRKFLFLQLIFLFKKTLKERDSMANTLNWA